MSDPDEPEAIRRAREKLIKPLTPSEFAKLADLERKQSAPPLQWIPYSDRKPTEKDGDSRGKVLWTYQDGSIGVGDWNAWANGDYWLPLSALPPLPVKKEKTQAELDWEAAFELWPRSADEELEKRRQSLREAYTAGRADERKEKQ